MPAKSETPAARGRGRHHQNRRQIVVDTLIDLGVETMFGYLGGVVLPLFDKLYDAPIRFIIPRHEQGGCHMADAYARASGKTGVIVATSGPGACNLVTGLATAMMDSIPMVAITGQVRTELIGNDAFQEADTTGITRPVTKFNSIVKDVRVLERTVREAFHIASTGRPGPVLIDLPVDVLVAKCPCNGKAEIDLPGYKIRTKGHARQISMAAEAINKSERPVLYVGGGVIIGNAAEELRTLAEKAHVPVTMTLLGLGSYDQRKPESLDMLGMHGSAYANYAVQESDLLIAVGARFDDRVTGKIATFAPHAKIVHIDIDPSSISKNVHVDIPVVGDAKDILTELTKEVEYRPREAWFAKIADWKQKYPFRFDAKSPNIKPQYIIDEVCRQTKSDAIIATGVGQHQMWSCPVLQIRPAAAVHQLRRPRHDGFRPARRHRRPDRLPGRDRHRLRRRPQLQHDDDRAGHRRGARAADQGLHLQQRLHGHGPPVAGALLRPPLLVQLPEEPQLRPGRRGPRRRRHHRGQERGRAEGHRPDARREAALRGRLPRRAAKKMSGRWSLPARASVKWTA